MKALVLYYSFEGNTKKVADYLSKEIGADIEEIKPVNEIKSKGFSKFIWGGSQVVMGKKPEILPIKSDISSYDIIFLGSPIWAGTYAPPVKTFVEDHIKGKKIAYFYTHDGGHRKSVERAKEAINQNNSFLGAIDFQGISKGKEEYKGLIGNWARDIIQK